MQQEDVINLLRRSGRALYGARWQAPLSRDLGVTDRALRYWIDGTNPVPMGEILPKLLKILERHENTLKDVKADVQARIVCR